MTDEARWQRRLERERAARKAAEELLEAKASELFRANQQLEREQHQLKTLIGKVERTINQLLQEADTPLPKTEVSTAELPDLLAGLINDNARTQRLLERQKFALDQHAIVSISDLSGRITYVNPRFCSISGYDKDEIIGKTYELIRSDYHPAAYFEGMEALTRAGRVWSGEIHSRAKDGSTFWVAATIVPILDENDRPVEFISIQTDLTAQKALEQEFEHEKNFLNSLTDSMDEGVYVINAVGQCLFVNQSAAQLLGRERETLLGTDFHGAVMKEFDQQFDDPILMAVMLDERVETDQFEFQRPDGSSFPVNIRARSLTIEGEYSSAVCVFRDITASRQLEEARAQAVRQAQQSAMAKSNFLANMSHEIRTPMNAVVGLSHLLMQTELDPRQRDYTSKIQRSARNLLGIINDILDFSKIDSGNLHLEAVPFDLDEILEDVYNVNQVKADEKKLSFVVENTALLSRSLIGDPLRIRQVLVNLTSNAIKFTASGSVTIQVSTALVDHERVDLRIDVRDTGIGIAPDKIGLLGIPFSQADSSTTRRFGGTGLGLSICFQIAQMMGGTLSVESVPGQGSCFSFKVPLPRSESTPAVYELPAVRVIDPQHRLTRLCHSFNTDCQRLEVDTLQSLSELEGSDPVLIDLFAVTHLSVSEWAQVVSQIGTPLIFFCSTRLSEKLSRKLPEHEVEYCHLFTLRALTAALSKETPLLKERTPLPLQRGNVLLVEDNEINTEVATRMLEAEGFRVTHAASGEQALSLPPGTRFDLVLMDIQMPGLDGYETTEKLRAQPLFASVPIIALTAHAMASDRDRALKSGMNDYLTKPIDPERLHNCITRWSDIPHTRPASAPEPPVPHPPSTLSVFNREQALRHLNGDTELLDRLAHRFAQGHEHDSRLIQQSIEQGGYADALRLSHTLKGIAQTLGLEELATASRACESALQTGDHQAARALSVLIELALNSALTALASSSLPTTPVQNPGPTNSPAATGEHVNNGEAAERARTLLKALIPLLEEGDFESLGTAQALLEVIHDEDIQELAQELVAQTDAFDFETALDTARQLQERLTNA
ncbi:hybrid sensor histidine kinase/response regulator [Marinobacterium litorale]|uniref:hybrid sensor histidine kinase/response regulator n=1 Tax=Marinobacterium litorale TaxID=404770 RepID=UPI00042A20AC|nr:PAS domain S-box protein [Marinobacterium litorale]